MLSGKNVFEDVMTLSVVDFKPAWGDKASNLSRIKGYARAAAKQGSDMVVFPEVALTGYDIELDLPKEEKMQYKNAEVIPGDSTLAVSELAKKYDMYIIFGMPERDADDASTLYNSVAICCPDGQILTYRKIHLPMDESLWATHGDKPMVFETPWGLVGLSICYDFYCFPELMRYARAKGARLFINPTAVCKDAAPAPLVQTELEGNAMMNTMYVASANLCGYDKENYFLGGSSIVAPSNSEGDIYYIAGKGFYDDRADEAGMHTATIDLTLAEQNTKINMFIDNPRIDRPDFRPEIYSKMYAELAEDEHWMSMHKKK